MFRASVRFYKWGYLEVQKQLDFEVYFLHFQIERSMDPCRKYKNTPYII